MSFARRDLLLGASATIVGALSGCVRATNGVPGGGDVATLASRQLSVIAGELLAEFPENATALGLDTAARSDLKSSLTDRSPEGHWRRGETAAARLARLKAIDRSGLSQQAALDVAVVEAAHERAVEGHRLPYGDVVVLNQQWSYRNSPYVVTQNTGAFVEIPDFLDSNHKIGSSGDAEAYLVRLKAYAEQLDGETDRLRRNASLGVVAPDFLLDKTLRQMKVARAEPIDKLGLVTSLAGRARTMPGDYRRGAEQIVRDEVAPAMDRQITELARHRERATHDAGVWKLPDGDRYYAFALGAATTSRLTPDEVHQLGLEQLRELQAQMEPILRSQGLTGGTIGQRMTALGKDPKYLFPNTAEGRAHILAYINERVADVRTRLPQAFATLVPGNLVVKRVPVEIEAGAPGGYASAGTIDGSVPGSYYINLRDTSIWPKFSLPTLTYHEGIPGHIWQGEYSYKLPLVRSLLAFNAYSEGWALYAEQLADELGVYEGDPIGRLGYLQSLAFRACRLVVDTGLHAKRWTRERAISWFAETNGSTVEEVSSEVDRYCSWPGQACGYKVGHIEINRLREKAQAALGGRYDFRLFNDAVVKTGGVPLTVLETRVDRHISERMA